jgi:hypothetical protein
LKSNIVLTRELEDYSRWTDSEIQSRGRQLAREAAQVWIGPKEKVLREPEVGDDDEGPDRQELRRRFWTGLNDYLVAEHPDLPDFEGRPSWSIRLPSGIRHIGFDLRFSVRHHHVGIDVWFWREQSFPVWERIRTSPAPYNDIIQSEWGFEQVDGRTRARMFLNQSTVDARDESTWPELYRWLGNTLSLLYEKVAPKLREEMDQEEHRKGQTGEGVRTPAETKSPGDLTDTQKIQLEFWTLFQNRLLERKVVTSAQTPRPQYWFNVPLGRSQFVLSNTFNTYDEKIGVRVYLRSRVADVALNQLEQSRAQIEQEVGVPLLWNPNPGAADKTIGVYRDIKLADRDAWPQYCDWLVDMTEKFLRAFRPRVRAINLDQESTDD